jgi:glycerate dehydrogenase
MKVVFLDRMTLGDDFEMKLPFEAEFVCYDFTPAENVAERIQDADVIFVNKVKLREQDLSAAKNLKVICEAATGYDNIDIAYCKEKGIGVCNVPGYSTNSVAQITVAMAMSLLNHLPEYAGYVASGAYTKSGFPNCVTPVFHEMEGMTWGVVGYGAIGKKVADIARACGCNILAYKRTPEEGVACVPLEELLKKADIISVHLPLSTETSTLIDKEKIALMKPNAIFINVARGAVVDEAALCDALANKKFAALGVDVYAREPFGEDSPYNAIKDWPNVCLTPHMAWGSLESRMRCFAAMLSNMRAFFDGTIQNRVEL